MCFELERLILDALGGAVTVEDEVQGFRYFDARDLLGFVDGTENPTGDALPLACLIQSDDLDFDGGSYVVVQKYLHKLDAWNALPTSSQESIIGRTKFDNVELDDFNKRKSHKTLATIVDWRATSMTFCGTTCRLDGPDILNLERISLDTRETYGSLKRC